MVDNINWDLYSNRLNIKGETNRDRNIALLKNNIKNKIINSPSCQGVTINSISKSIIVLDTDKKNIKKINSLPDESFNIGDNIIWNSLNWLVTDWDCANEIQTIGKMTLCNYTLKLQLLDGSIQSCPAVFKNNTSNLDENEMISLADGLSSIRVRYNPNLVDVLKIGVRLMIDNRLLNEATDNPNCYVISDVLLESYDSINGIFNISLKKDEYNASIDSKELGVCDYKEMVVSTGSAKITYSGDCVIKCGGSYKTFTGIFNDADGNILDLTPIWSIESSIIGLENNFTTIIDDSTKSIKIKCNDIEELIGSILTLNLTEDSNLYSASIEIEVISL